MHQKLETNQLSNAQISHNLGFQKPSLEPEYQDYEMIGNSPFRLTWSSEISKDNNKFKFNNFDGLVTNLQPQEKNEKKKNSNFNLEPANGNPELKNLNLPQINTRDNQVKSQQDKSKIISQWMAEYFESSISNGHKKVVSDPEFDQQESDSNSLCSGSLTYSNGSILKKDGDQINFKNQV